MAEVFDVAEEDLARRFREAEKERSAAVQRGIASAIMAGAEVVARVAPKDLGNLKRSVRGVVRAPGGYIEVEAPYAVDVEIGARPHFVPLKDLLPWCVRHVAPGENPVRFAKALQQKIGREGTKPTYFMRKTLPLQRRILKAEIERELKGGG
jgi:hypothetical protein